MCCNVDWKESSVDPAATSLGRLFHSFTLGFFPGEESFCQQSSSNSTNTLRPETDRKAFRQVENKNHKPSTIMITLNV